MKRWQFWAGLAISALFLWYTLSNQDLGSMWSAIVHANYLWILPGVAVYFIGVWVRTWRWQYMLRPIQKIPLRILFPVVTIGYMGNNIYPARAGELLRAFLLKQREAVPVSASIATIFIERIFDAVVMMLFIFINLPELAKLQGESGFIGNIQQVAVVGTGIFFGALVAFLLAAMFPAVTSRVVAWSVEHLIPLRFRDTAHGLATKFLEGLACLRSPRDAFMVFFTSLLIWLLETAKYWFIMQGFPFAVSFFTLMLNNGISNIITSIPSAPGYIGTFDASSVAVLTAYGVDKAVATAYTLVLHAALWFPITIVGAFFFLRAGLSVEKARESVDTPLP
jgi:glycosyltransferase 2 family protein